MATKLSADSFLSSVRQSGLVDDSQLKKFWQGFEQSGKDLQATEIIASGMVDSQILTRWQVDKLLQGKHKGFFLGKYKLLSLLGSGGMSAVYLAEHTLMKRRVAIKVLPQSRIEDTSYLDRFHREAQAVATLDHPNIMRAYDVDQEGKVHFLVMEYIDGQSLLEMVNQRGPMGYVEAAEIMRQSAEGLDHAHARGMIHRDIKPGNILVDRKGVVKILDMGLAMFFDPTGKDDEQASLTIQHDERVLGTADYLSPEQALNSHNVDIRTDIYSLGCTFYFILTGHPPYPEGSLAQRLLFHQTKPPAPVENDRPDIPASLVLLLRKMIEKRPEDRYQTARETYDAFTRWLIENGDSEWREKNSMVIASSGIGSNIHGASGASMGTGSGGSGNLGKNSAPVAAPTAAPVVTAMVAPMARPVQPPQSAPNYPPQGSPVAQQYPPNYAPQYAPGQFSPGQFPPGQFPPGQFPPGQYSPGQFPQHPHGQQPQYPPPQNPQPQNPAGGQPYAPQGTNSGQFAMPVSAPPAPAQLQQVGSVPPQSRPAVPPPSPPAAAPQAITSPTWGGIPPEVSVTPTASPQGDVPDFSGFGAINFDQPVVTTTTVQSASSTNLSPGNVSSSNTTSPKAKSKGKATGYSSSSGLFKSKKAQWIFGAVGVTVFLALSITYYNWIGRAKKPVARNKKESIEYVVGGSGKYKSLSDAIAAAKGAGGNKPLIRVMGSPVIQERLDLTDLPKGTEIFAEQPGGPTLAPKGSEPVLDVRGLSGFKLRGFNLEAKGKEVGIRVSGKLPQLGISQCTLTGFTKHGILAEGVSGDETNRVSFESIKFKAGEPTAIGVSLKPGPSIPAYVTVENCRFQGPMAAGIVIETDAETLSLEKNVFSDTGVGIRFQGANHTYKNVSITNNTFYKLQHGIVLTNMPNAMTTERFGVFNCLFAEVKGSEFVVESGFDKATFDGLLHAGTGNNFTDKPALDANSPIFGNGGQAAMVYLFKSVNPSDSTFLAPSDKSPQKDTASSGPSDVYVGAIGPN